MQLADSFEAAFAVTRMTYRCGSVTLLARSTKRYLRYSEMTWRVLRGNRVQYINRLPAR
jgi:hypothetical protein